MRRSQGGMFLPDPWVPIEPYLAMKHHYAVASMSGTLVASGNRALYVPIVLPCDVTLYSISFAAANGTGNYDLGLYDSAFTRLASSGSTAMTAAGIKTLSLPDLRFCGGDTIYPALALSSTSGQVIRPGYNTTASLKGTGVGAEDSALPLPATGTPVDITTSVFPLFAFGVR